MSSAAVLATDTRIEIGPDKVARAGNAAPRPIRRSHGLCPAPNRTPAVSLPASSPATDRASKSLSLSFSDQTHSAGAEGLGLVLRVV